MSTKQDELESTGFTVATDLSQALEVIWTDSVMEFFPKTTSKINL